LHHGKVQLHLSKHVVKTEDPSFDGNRFARPRSVNVAFHPARNARLKHHRLAFRALDDARYADDLVQVMAHLARGHLRVEYLGLYLLRRRFSRAIWRRLEVEEQTDAQNGDGDNEEASFGGHDADGFGANVTLDEPVFLLPACRCTFR